MELWINVFVDLIIISPLKLGQREEEEERTEYTRTTNLA